MSPSRLSLAATACTVDAACTVAAGAAGAAVVTSDAFAGQKADLWSAVNIDVDDNGINDLIISVSPPPLHGGDNGIRSLEEPSGEVAAIRGDGGGDETFTSFTEIAVLPGKPPYARPYAPGETVDDSALYRGEAFLYGTPENGGDFDDPTVFALDLVSETVAEEPLGEVGDSAYFGFRIVLGPPRGEGGGEGSVAPRSLEAVEPPIVRFGWLELSRGSVIVGEVGLQSVPGAGAPVPGVSEIPLPASGLVLLGGLAGLGALRARRRARG